MTLDKLKTGQSAKITAVGGEGALRNRLLDMGLIPKTTLTLQKIAPLGDPIEIRVRGYELTLRLEDAKKITVALDTADKKARRSRYDTRLSPETKTAEKRRCSTH